MNDTIEEVIHHPLFVPAVVGLTGFASGLGLGFFLGKRKAEVVTEVVFHEVEPVELDTGEVVVEEVQRTEAPIPVIIDEDVAREKGILKVGSLADLSPSMLTLPDENGVEETVEVLEVVEETTEEVVEEAPEDGIEWDWNEELEKRKETEPYILHLEEYTQQELGFAQYPLTYYAMDAILVDDNLVPIPNHAGVVGELNFGHGSGQVDVVYVRNHERKSEYEITRLDQSFALEIHGLEVENNERIRDLRHGKVLKFRQD